MEQGVVRQRRMPDHAPWITLEQTHVHDVYARVAPFFQGRKEKAWPKVRQFLEELEPGSLVADIGE